MTLLTNSGFKLFRTEISFKNSGKIVSDYLDVHLNIVSEWLAWI